MNTNVPNAAEPMGPPMDRPAATGGVSTGFAVFAPYATLMLALAHLLARRRRRRGRLRRAPAAS